MIVSNSSNEITVLSSKYPSIPERKARKSSLHVNSGRLSLIT